jgi:hypothetical protein
MSMNHRHPQILKLLKNPISININESDRGEKNDKNKIFRGVTKK